MTSDAKAILVIDLAFGDCGKGTIVDYLTRQTGAHTVVRFNGGPQAGHNVVTPDGRHHTFSQFGSGTFVPGVRTVLSRFMLIEPYAMLNEAAHLEMLGVRDPLSRLLIDRRCPVITPAHQAANRLVELSRGARADGTCGLGIGQTMQDMIDYPRLMLRASDLRDRATVRSRLREIRDLKIAQIGSFLNDRAQSYATGFVGSALRTVFCKVRESVRSADPTQIAHGDLDALRHEPRARQSIDTLVDLSWIDAAVENYCHVAKRAKIADESEIAKALNADGTVIFEGAQGVLLDEIFGFHPHTTWSTTTFANADTLLNEIAHPGERKRIGVLRSYFTRHGAGPFVTEDNSLREKLPEPHNNDAGWQGRFRVGLFDAVAARYAISVAGGVDSLAITHMDRLNALPKQICLAYAHNGREVSSSPASIDDYVDSKDGKIIDIKPKTASLAESVQRTKVLQQCLPILTLLPDDRCESFLDTIRRELNLPIGIISRGPSARDKELRIAGL